MFISSLINPDTCRLCILPLLKVYYITLRLVNQFLYIQLSFQQQFPGNLQTLQSSISQQYLNILSVRMYPADSLGALCVLYTLLTRQPNIILDQPPQPRVASYAYAWNCSHSTVPLTLPPYFYQPSIQQGNIIASILSSLV